MKSKRHQQILSYSVVLACMGLTAVAILCQPALDFIETSPIPEGLPASLPPYQVLQPLFCESESCRFNDRFDMENPLPKSCPACNSKLNPVSVAEQASLGIETDVFHRSYISPENILLDVAVVVAGKDRNSLHRPQNCLPAQGIQIDATQTIQARLPGAPPVPLRLLTLHHVERSNQRVSFAYWYTNGRVQTPYQIAMYLEVAKERIIDGKNRRWAYVAITAIRGRAAEQRRAIEALTAELAPIFAKQQAAYEASK